MTPSAYHTLWAMGLLSGIFTLAHAGAVAYGEVTDVPGNVSDMS
jgi:hypothetical protein